MSNPDHDPAFDTEPDEDAAAYEEWAALAGEPARPSNEHPRLADSRSSFDAIVSTLTKTQIEAASHPGSILVLAGAGTGKTSTLTAAVAHRIAVDEIPPHRVLAVTFTNKAAGEMASRIRAALGPDAAPHWLGTFHGLAARQLRAAPEVASLRDNFDILDADDSRRILRRIMKAMNLSSDEDEGGKRDPVKIVAGHIGKFKDLLMTPKGAGSHVENRIAEGNRTGAAIDVAGLTMAAKVYPEYQNPSEGGQCGRLRRPPPLADAGSGQRRRLSRPMGRKARLGPCRRVSGRQFRKIHVAEDAGVPRQAHVRRRRR
jgi:DNA helicase-2/ATP-dependent DNA helicase PcrA